jgi:hypothetical protein
VNHRSCLNLIGVEKNSVDLPTWIHADRVLALLLYCDVNINRIPQLLAGKITEG